MMLAGDLLIYSDTNTRDRPFHFIGQMAINEVQEGAKREREGERERVGGPEINQLILPHRRIVDKPSPRAYYS